MEKITDKERIDEALELLWVLDEEGHNELDRFSLSSDDPDTALIVETLINEKILLFSKYMRSERQERVSRSVKLKN